MLLRHKKGAGGFIDTLKDIGGTILNRTIDVLPVELHLPGYSFCGPGTRLQSRLQRGDVGVNKLDRACREHDIAYSKSGDSKDRAEADRILAERAWQRVKAGDASATEKAAAWTVTNLMKLKSKFGGGTKIRRRRRNVRRRSRRSQPTAAATSGRGLYLRTFKGKGLKKKHRTTRKKRATHLMAYRRAR